MPSHILGKSKSAIAIVLSCVGIINVAWMLLRHEHLYVMTCSECSLRFEVVPEISWWHAYINGPYVAHTHRWIVSRPWCDRWRFWTWLASITDSVPSINAILQNAKFSDKHSNIVGVACVAVSESGPLAQSACEYLQTKTKEQDIPIDETEIHAILSLFKTAQEDKGQMTREGCEKIVESVRVLLESRLRNKHGADKTDQETVDENIPP